MDPDFIFPVYMYWLAEITFTFRESVQTVVEGVGEVTVYIDRVGITDVDFILMVTGRK